MAPWQEVEEDDGADEPEQVGITDFTLAYHGGQTLDPITCSDGVQVQLASLLYEPLFQLDGAFQPQPLLCTDWTVSEDGLTYTLDIRQGVTFSDGSTLAADDVATSLRRAMSSQRYGNRLADIRQVAARDGRVVITLSRHNSRLLALLDIPVVKAGTEEDGIPVGTGPYLFITSGEGAYLTANPDWWQGEDLPVEQIELLDVREDDTVPYLFMSREIQVYAGDLTQGNLAISGSLDTVDIPTGTMQFVGINVRRETLQNQMLRRALQQGIPRKTVTDGYLSGHALPAQFPISPVSAGYPEEREEPYSLDVYRQTVTAALESGSPVSLRMLVHGDSASKVAIAQYLAQNLSVDGLLEVTVEALPWADYLEALERGDFDLYYGAVRLTADWDVSALIGTGGALNYGGWSAVDTDAMLEAYRTGGEAERENLYQHLGEAVPLIPVCFQSDALLTHSGTVENATPTAANIFYDFPSWTIHLVQPEQREASS